MQQICPDAGLLQLIRLDIYFDSVNMVIESEVYSFPSLSKQRN